MNSSVLASPFGASFDDYVQELQAFVESLPERARQLRESHARAASTRESLAQQCRALRERMPTLSGELVNEALAQSWRSVAERLRALGDELGENADVQRIMSRHTELARSFEVWAAKFRRTTTVRRIEVGRFKPLAATRTLFHVLMAVFAVVSYQFFLDRTGALIVLGSFLAVFGGLEISRRIWPQFNVKLLEAPGLKQMARPDEFHKVNSATYFLIALCAITPFLSREAVVCGILILGFCDPAAAWVGKRYGTKKLYRRKSWVGSSTFFATGVVLTVAYLAVFTHQGFSARVILAAIVASFAGAVAELLSTKLDDNLTVPIASAVAASLFL